MNSNCALSPEWLNPRTRFNPSDRSETVITLDEAAAGGKDSLLIDWCLAERGEEPSLRTMLERLAADHHQLTVVGLHSVPLDHYPSQIVCFALWVGTTRGLAHEPSTA